MPHIATIMRWLIVHVEFREQYVRARESSADHFAEKVVDISEGVLDFRYDASAARVAMDGFKWAASKQQPRKYGDNRHIDLSGSVVETRVVDAPDWMRELLGDRVTSGGAKPLRHLTVDGEATEVEAGED
jgi:hypothetical protein